jgi:hypothetical protein
LAQTCRFTAEQDRLRFENAEEARLLRQCASQALSMMRVGRSTAQKVARAF